MHTELGTPSTLIDNWLKEVASKKMVGPVMLDFSSAFDVIDHDQLITKLRGYGFSLTALSLMES